MIGFGPPRVLSCAEKANEVDDYLVRRMPGSWVRSYDVACGRYDFVHNGRDRGYLYDSELQDQTPEEASAWVIIRAKKALRKRTGS